ncbi:hypothetical protein I79_016242 [Cricetulus griseus]|uniref:Uncharacterized protein n=1 Tax=Cricetulus griseus TaxID=10029 RepID=G3HYV0_CRIGR|nr:hypothetical protein I79_016242 [Cricetulus griseus]
MINVTSTSECTFSFCHQDELLVMVMHAYKPSTQRMRQIDHKFKATQATGKTLSQEEI